MCLSIGRPVSKRFLHDLGVWLLLAAFALFSLCSTLMFWVLTAIHTLEPKSACRVNVEPLKLLLTLCA